jgi:hypothetical protein
VEPAEVLQPGKGTVDNPPHAPESEPYSVARRAITGFTPRCHSFAAVLVVVVATIGDHLVRALARPAAFARDDADPIDEREQLGHVVAISARKRPGSGVP